MRRRRQDRATHDTHDDALGFYTPILKGFLTEMGLEAANLGMQVFGGHGYIHEHGMEQIARDARIATLYEGTTGIRRSTCSAARSCWGRAENACATSVASCSFSDTSRRSR